MRTRTRIGRVGRLLTIAAMATSLLARASTAGASTQLARQRQLLVADDRRRCALGRPGRPEPPSPPHDLQRAALPRRRAQGAGGVARQRPSTAGGKRARTLALAAFADYAAAAKGWAATGRARLRGRPRRRGPQRARLGVRLVPATGCSWQQPSSSARCHSRRWMFIRVSRREARMNWTIGPEERRSTSDSITRT